MTPFKLFLRNAFLTLLAGAVIWVPGSLFVDTIASALYPNYSAADPAMATRLAEDIVFCVGAILMSSVMIFLFTQSLRGWIPLLFAVSAGLYICVPPVIRVVISRGSEASITKLLLADKDSISIALQTPTTVYVDMSEKEKWIPLSRSVFESHFPATREANPD